MATMQDVARASGVSVMTVSNVINGRSHKVSPETQGRVLEAIGLHASFDDLHDIHASGLRPKPDPHGYALLCERFRIDPAAALLVDDMAQNLAPAKALGMTTVWVDNGSERGNHGAAPDFIDHRIDEVGEWLEGIIGDRE